MARSSSSRAAAAGGVIQQTTVAARFRINERSTGEVDMRTYAWVAIGMLTAGLGGALATWGSMVLMDRGVEPQSQEVLGNLTALGGVLAGLCGGIASIGRGQTANRKEFLGGLAAIGLGLGLVAVINPAYLFSPFLLVVAPLQGLAALLGGLAALAALWTVLRFAGIRNDSDLAMPFRGSMPTPLSKVGLSAIALSFVLPMLPYLKDSLEISVLSEFLFQGGLLLYGAALFLHGATGSRKLESNVVEPRDAADS